MISLSDLKSKRASMSRGAWKYDNVNGTVEAPEAGPNRYLGKTVCEMYIANVEANATGIVATHNAADCLIAVTEAALTMIEADHALNRARSGERMLLSIRATEAYDKLREALAKVQP